ncbi:MAG: sigma-E processing peptidase SpoIIGA [Clostridiaceae bacterium]|jgi:stage II sporulation protein GA (sporulation sigma-E factor processing peptidase)|nr:sigma-E processing peptidase SpoIIGA [Clostridiaceae bacterium]
MEVYIEFVIFDNLMINLLLIYAVKTVLKLKIRTRRMFFAALVGAGFAVSLPYIPAFHELYKLGTAVLMPLLFGGFKKFKGYLLNAAVFVLLSFALGGAVFALGLWLPYFNGNSGVLGASAAGGIFLLYATRQLVLGIRARQVAGEAEVKIHTDGGVIIASAFIDNGNVLTDAVTGKPVIIITGGLLNGTGITPERLISVKTVTGERALPLVTLPLLEIKMSGEEAGDGVSRRGVTGGRDNVNGSISNDGRDNVHGDISGDGRIECGSYGRDNVHGDISGNGRGDGAEGVKKSGDFVTVTARTQSGSSGGADAGTQVRKRGSINMRRKRRKRSGVKGYFGGVKANTGGADGGARSVFLTNVLAALSPENGKYGVVLNAQTLAGREK